MRPELRPLRQANPTPVQPTYRWLGRLMGGVLPRLFRVRWEGLERLPATGGVLVVANHLSYADPAILAWTLIWAGRWPRFLAKSQLFSVPVLGWLGRACGQIPVLRDTERAGDALLAAEDALARGECVVIYPEGTVTRDPDLWPMTGRPGAARLALRAGVPVVPVGQWGTHEVMRPPKAGLPRLFPRKRVSVAIGEPLDLSDLRDADDEKRAARRATERMLAAITDLVAGLRGRRPPAGRYDRRVGRRVEAEAA